MRVSVRSVWLFLCIILVSGCATRHAVSGGSPHRSTAHKTVSHKVVKHRHFQQYGRASYYARALENRKTANGERYHARLRTAAHRTLPLGSYVRVTNLHNGKSVVVRINDRGPYVKGRIIDLSRSAFQTIANPSQGVIRVKIQVIR